MERPPLRWGTSFVEMCGKQSSRTLGMRIESLGNGHQKRHWVAHENRDRCGFLGSNRPAVQDAGMNLDTLVQWSRRTPGIAESPSKEVLQRCCRQRLEEKFGWLRDYGSLWRGGRRQPAEDARRRS